jgi:catechol 2,3-dioxygenase-like lactoylglutathione lyase family enzyme
MITGINHITLTVADIRATFDFYTEVLGLRPVMRSEWSAYFLAGETWVAVVKGDPREDGRYDHVAFGVADADFPTLCRAIRSAGCAEWKSNESEGASFYFLDPSGNKFEIHCGTLESRIQGGKANWGEGVRWFV